MKTRRRAVSKTDTETENLMGCISVFVMLLTWPVFAAWKGFVLSKLWGWFAVPVFHLPALSIWQAVGLCLVVGMFTAASRKRDEESNAEWLGYALMSGTVGPALSLFFGWLVRLWM